MRKISLLTILLVAAPASRMRAEDSAPVTSQDDHAYLIRLADQIRAARGTQVSRDMVDTMIKNKIKSREELTRAKRADGLAQAIKLSRSIDGSAKTSEELQLALQALNKQDEYVAKAAPSPEELGRELALKAEPKQEKIPMAPWLLMPATSDAPDNAAPLPAERLPQTDLVNSRPEPAPVAATSEAIASLDISKDEMRDAVAAPADPKVKNASVWISTSSANFGRKK